MESINQRKHSNTKIPERTDNQAQGHSTYLTKQVGVAKPRMTLKAQTAQAIIDGNHEKALELIAERNKQGERISICADNLEGRALQGDWQMAKSLAKQRFELNHN